MKIENFKRKSHEKQTIQSIYSKKKKQKKSRFPYKIHERTKIFNSVVLIIR